MRLLLAEDERSLSDILLMVLKKNQYDVDTVYNGTLALENIKKQAYDGAILDVMMPGMDGITVLKKIRESGKTLPILILTARSEIEDKVSGLDGGANDYLPKPFDTRELLARIRAMLRTEALPVNIPLQAGNLRLDHSTLELCSDTGRFRLSGREYRMMQAFMKNPGCFITAEQFMEITKEKKDDEGNRAVKAYVLFLNRKLEALHANMRIRSEGDQCFRLEVGVYDK